jgi:hypothetical protein
MKHLVTLSVLFIILNSCANYELKKTCENTNWFDYAQSVAYSGRYLEEDKLVKQCKDVEIINGQQLDGGFKLGREKMCSYDEVQRRGQSGEPVYFSFCDGLSEGQMKSKYELGLKQFCTETSGLSYGRSGQVYKKVCNFQSEIQFMKGYRPGRSEYLALKIKNSKIEIEQLNINLKQFTYQQDSLNSQYHYLPRSEECEKIKVFNEATKSDIERTVCKEDPRITGQRSSLLEKLENTRSEISEIIRKKESLNKSIQAFENELLTLK